MRYVQLKTDFSCVNRFTLTREWIHSHSNQYMHSEWIHKFLWIDSHFSMNGFTTVMNRFTDYWIAWIDSYMLCELINESIHTYCEWIYRMWTWVNRFTLVVNGFTEAENDSKSLKIDECMNAILLYHPKFILDSF